MTKNTDNLDNIQFIQYLNRKVLEEAEEAMTLELPGDELAPKDKNDKNPKPELTAEELKIAGERRIINRRRHRMWGIRNPIVWMLEKIADTELKIARYRPEAQQAPQLSEREEELFNSLRGEENP